MHGLLIMSYHIIMKINHWLAALMIFTITLAGYYMTHLAPPDIKYQIYGLHKACGMIFLFFMLWRLTARLLLTKPEGFGSKLEKIIASITVFLLYILMIITPLSGYLMSSFGGYPVDIFFITLPNFIEPDNALGAWFNEWHSILAYTMLGLIALHILGWAKHYFIDKVNLLKRMM